MKTLFEKIENARMLVNQIIKDNNTVTGIWFEFDDIELDELRSAADHYKSELEFDKYSERMRLQLSCYVIPNATIFCYSRKIKVETHVVVETAIKNI